MGIIPAKYDKYIRFFTFILKYWNSNVFPETEEELNAKNEEFHSWEPSPQELVADLKKMGPAYIKLGQFLSTRPDLLPEPYLEALTDLQDDIEITPFSEMKEVFEEEVGSSIESVFSDFEENPIASASIGQVYKAKLKSGKTVAVKIQRPKVHQQILEDLEILMTLSERAESYNKTARKFSIHAVVEELRYVLLQELDYEKERKNLVLLKKNMRMFDHLYVPRVYPAYCTSHVLIMEFVDGNKVTDLSEKQLAQMPKKQMVNNLIEGYLKQIVVDGFAHADPHPGNIHVTQDQRLVLMDLGMVAYFDGHLQDVILKLMLGLSNNDGNLVTDVLLDVSDYEERETDLEGFRKKVIRKVQQNQNSKAEDLQSGKDILEMNKIAIHEGIRLPVEFVMLGKILLNMDQIIAVLSPEHELQKTVKRYMEHLMKDKMWKQMKSGKLLQTLLESKELMENTPHRLNKLSENLAENKFKLQVDAFDETRFLMAFQKVANRIATALIVAALILGAGMVMRVPTKWMIWGYPGFAILLFIFAAAIGLYLVYQILFKDESDQ